MTAREILFDGNPPWGFRMNGGADAGHPLRISRVNPGSKAEAKGVREGDLITSINGHSTKCLSNSDSHALLRTVKENLRIGLNEDQNGSPRRRSKEIKSSPAVPEKEVTPAANKENSKPSRSKLRRQRKQRLKVLLKEKLLGYKETPGHVLTDGPVLDDSQGGSSSAGDEAELGGAVPKDDDDDSSRKLYDNVELDDNGRKPCSDAIIPSSETAGIDSPRCQTSSFIHEEKVAVTVERIGPRKETDCQKNPPSNLSERSESYSGPGKSGSPYLSSNSLKTALVASEQAQVNVSDDKTSSNVPKIEERVVENNRTSESAGVNKAAEVVICSPTTATCPYETGVCLVQHPDDTQEEIKKCYPSNDLSDVLSSTTTDEEEYVYELIPSDVHTPIIAHPDELRLRCYLGSMALHEPYDITTEETRVCPPTEIPAYFLPPKRYLDVISEENSDLSDGDRPWENAERIRQANSAIDTIPEDWFGSQDGIDTSWIDGKSLDDVHDIPIVTDSHSDSETLVEDSSKSNERCSGHRSNVETNPSSSQNGRKNIASHLYSSKLSLQPIKVDTVKNGGTVEGPNSEVVEIVYLDSSDSEAISSSKSDSNLAATIRHELSDVSTSSRVVDVVNTPVLPSANIDVVEIVCIDTSDSEAVSCKSESSICTSVPPVEKELALAPDGRENANVRKANKAISAPKTNQTEIKNNLPINDCSQREENQISEMISDITQSANEIISTSNEHLALMTPCTSPSIRKSRRTNVTVEAKLNLNERCSSLPLLDDGSCKTFMSTRSVCSDMGEDNEFPHFISYNESDTSSQCTTKPYQLDVTSLKELSLNAVLRLPFGVSFLKQLGFDQSEYDSYSGYMPEGSECSFSSKQPLSEREYILADDSENDNESISGSLPPRSMPGESLPNSPPPPVRRDSGKWVGARVPRDTKLPLDVSPDQTKTIKCSLPNAVDLLDLHQKFVERRGYHESDDKFPVAKYDQHVGKKEDDNIDDFNEFRALQEYHALRQQRMRDAKRVGSKEKCTDIFKGSVVNPDKSGPNPREIDRLDKENILVSPASIDISSATGKENVGKLGEGVDQSADEGSKGNQVVDNSRLLELIQREEFKGSSEDVNMTTTMSYPYWILLEKQTGSSGEDTKDASPESSKSIEMESEPLHDDPGKITHNSIPSSHLNVHHNNLLGVQEKVQVQNERPKSVPPSGDKFRQMMYEEYMNKLSELSQRRRLKAIKLSEPSKCVSTPSLPAVDHLPREFMDRVKERMIKLGLTDDFVLVDNSLLAERVAEKPPIEEAKKLPKHVRELMDMADELDIIGERGLLIEIDDALSPERKGFLTARGVWSPAQTPETERKQLDFSSAENRDRKEQEAQPEEPAPAVWTPRSAGPSPTLGRKFRPVNFQSPPPQRKEYSSKAIKTELPKDLPPETTTSATSTTVSSSSRLISSTSENSTLTSTQLRLPSSQNPTITLLQKAREGQIPKGAQYLDDTAPDRPSGIAPDDIIYSVKKEYTSADEEGVKKVVELTPKKFAGIGPTTRDGVPIGLRSEVNENNQQRWYKRMYDSLHKTADRDNQYPYSSYAGGYASEPERLGGYDSDASVSKYATLDRRKIRNKENDFTTSTLPRNRYAPAVKHAVNIYKNQPGRIEDYEPGHSSIAEVEKKQWWDEVLDIFDGELNNSSKDVYATPSRQSFTNYALKDAGYDSDSTLVFKRRENMSEDLSPAEQKMAYKVVQRGGEVPLHGLRKAMPDRPKEPIGNPIPTPPRDHASRLHRQESPHRYVESEVNIHYKSPIRAEAKAAWPEDELAEKQAEIMRRIYQEQRRTKYLNELHDMYSRRHTDNLLPSQKSPIPLNRYDDFPLELQPPRPRDRTPEPKLVARALYNFVGQTPRELSFRRGDIIYVRRQIDKNWYEGEHNAMIGLFPFNYVEIIPYDGIRTLPKKANEGQARAKFNFQAQTHLELSLVKGELVLLTRRVDENWFEGRIGNRKGIFPVSYVEVLVEPGERNLSPIGPISTKPVNAPASHSVMLNGAKDIGQQHYQPPRPALYSSSSLPPQSKMSDIGMVSQSLHIDTQSDPVPYRVLYNYKPQNDDELELKEGDVVYVMEKCDDGWYVGSLHRNGQFGTFPGNYVERIIQ